MRRWRLPSEPIRHAPRWGMHRTGTKTRVIEYDEFAEKIRGQSARLEDFENVRLEDVSREDAGELAAPLFGLIESSHVGIGRSPIVSGSKVLHHLLPDLLPPLDLRYTQRFFFKEDLGGAGPGEQFSKAPGPSFEMIFPYPAQLAREGKGVAIELVSLDKNPCGTGDQTQNSRCTRVFRRSSTMRSSDT